MEDYILKVKDLSVELNSIDGKYQILDEISFDLARGTTLGVVGESGCGKSMLANSIMGLISKPLKVKSGSILFEGQELVGLKEKELQKIRGKKIAMIFQDPMTSLNPIIKCGHQIVETIRAHENVSKQEAKDRALSLISQVGLDNPGIVYNKIPAELSGGQRQRIVIAMALACSPDLIICDEPTTALDVRIQKQILQLIKKLVKETNSSCIFISHDMGVVANMSDYVMIMYAGQIVEISDVKGLFSCSRHPYTKGLRASLPQSALEGHKLKEIVGSVPMLNALPEGCLFAPRCEQASERCFKECPSLVDFGGYSIRCFNC